MTTKAVLKIGGEVVADPQVLLPTLRDVAALVDVGGRVAVVHGAGPQAGRLQEELGLRPTKIAGQRVTDPDTLRVVKCVLGGEVSIDLVAAALSVGLRAVGLSCVSDRIVTAVRRADPVLDLGLVGEVTRVGTELLEHLWAGGFVPVLNPIGVDALAPHGAPAQVYNINADTVAAALAGALRADHLVLVTAVGGVRRDKHDPSTRIEAMHASEARAAIEDGTIDGGMIPKVEEALAHLARGIGAVHIVPPGMGVVREAVQSPGRHGTVLLAD